MLQNFDDLELLLTFAAKIGHEVLTSEFSRLQLGGPTLLIVLAQKADFLHKVMPNCCCSGSGTVLKASGFTLSVL